MCNANEEDKKLDNINEITFLEHKNKELISSLKSKNECIEILNNEKNNYKERNIDLINKNDNLKNLIED